MKSEGLYRCKNCGALVTSLARHLNRKRCKRVKERRDERGMKQETRGYRNGQKPKKITGVKK